MRQELALRAGRLSEAEREQALRILQQWAHLTTDPQPPGESRAQRVAWLRAAARGRWDLRCGQERERIPASADILPADIASRAAALAGDWGMVGSRPVRGDFDAVIVLGGQLTSNLNRSAAAAQMLRSGAVRCPLVIGLACHRPLSDAERASAGVPIATESGAMELGLARAFGAGAWCEVAPGLREQVLPDGLRLLLADMPVRDARPTTGESFEWLLASGQLAGAGSLLSVTTSLYWIQNHCNLLIRLPPGATLATCGTTVDAAGSPVFRAQHFLQEIKAAVDVLADLLVWAQ